LKTLISKLRPLWISCLIVVATVLVLWILDSLEIICIYKSYCEVQSQWDIPEDATDLKFSFQRGYIYYLKVDFKASSAGLANFSRLFCNGILHTGYDPYHAVDTWRRIPGKQVYLIKLDAWDYSYYSYSPDTPDTIRGNRCQNYDSPPRRIRISQIAADLYEVSADLGHFRPGLNCSGQPCWYGSNYVRPKKEFPLVIIGLEETASGQYRLVTNEICLEFQTDFDRMDGSSIRYRWQHLENATLHWSVDGQSQGKTFVTYDGNLSRDFGSEYSSGFDYCLLKEWTPGLHHMELEITTTVGQHIAYQWTFLVRETGYSNTFDSAI
jgi:hypothetical protein